MGRGFLIAPGANAAQTATWMLENWQGLAKRANGDRDLLQKLDAWCRVGEWIRTGKLETKKPAGQ